MRPKIMILFPRKVGKGKHFIDGTKETMSHSCGLERNPETIRVLSQMSKRPWIAWLLGTLMTLESWEPDILDQWPRDGVKCPNFVFSSLESKYLQGLVSSQCQLALPSLFFLAVIGVFLNTVLLCWFFQCHWIWSVLGYPRKTAHGSFY